MRDLVNHTSDTHLNATTLPYMRRGLTSIFKLWEALMNVECQRKIWLVAKETAAKVKGLEVKYRVDCSHR